MKNKKRSPTYLELGLDGFDLVIERKQFVSEAVQEGNAQLVQCPWGVVTFHTHQYELVFGATSGHEMLGQSGPWIRLPVKLVFEFTPQWDSANFFRTTKKLLCSVQECRDTWGDTAWKKIEDEEYGTIDPKKGKAETENINNMHEL